LDYDSELCLVISDKFIILVYLYTIHLDTSCAQHCFCSRLHLEFVRKGRFQHFQN